MSQLVHPGELTVEKARALLATCTDLTEIKRIKDVSMALSTYARAQRAARESIVDAEEIETRALRRAGELTLALPKAKVRGSTSPGEKSKRVEGPSKMQATATAGLERNAVHLAEKLARLPEDAFEQAIARARESGVAKPRSVVKASMAHVGQSSGNYEWRSPKWLVLASRFSLGGTIDVDVASSEAANEVIQARTFYTAENSGLAAKKWKGRVYGNPPYCQPLIEDFCDRIVTQYRAGHTTAAVWVTNNATETDWGQLLLRHAVRTLFPDGRIAFVDQDGHEQPQPLQGQMVNYFGPNPELFEQGFHGRGVIR